MRAILVSVDFADILALTLPYNRHHFDDVCVVTTSGDVATIRVAAANDAWCYCTDAFYKDGADFNKWLALEEGLDYFGRIGWTCIMDADILWPKNATDLMRAPLAWSSLPAALQCGNLHTPLRRMWHRPSDTIPSESDWKKFPLHRQQHEFAGYTQIFHADDPVLSGLGHWHETDWRHCGGADSFFQAKWPQERKVRPPFEVLHLGESGINWCGRATPYLDGTLPAEQVQRITRVRGYVQDRQGKSGTARFRHEKVDRTS